MTSIATVTAGDLAEVVPLMQAYCRFYETAPDQADLRSLAEALIADPAHEGAQLVARDDAGEAVGFATLYWSWSTTDAAPIAVMNDLYVTETARGAGTGRALIEACAAEASGHGKRRLTWETALENHRAQRVYAATGAARTTWHTYTLVT